MQVGVGWRGRSLFQGREGSAIWGAPSCSKSCINTEREGRGQLENVDPDRAALCLVLALNVPAMSPPWTLEHAP